MNPPTVIGLEAHIRLKTATKLFCSCPSDPEIEPNVAVCPVCLGYPGTLPVLNGEAVTLALRVACALHSDINGESRFDRKHYFYPDLPRGYQITQQMTPLAEGGALDFEGPRGAMRADIDRLHLEEDAARLIHEERTGVLADYNRAGCPLLEVVTRPCFGSPEEAVSFMKELRLLVMLLDVSTAEMDRGELRCDANISLGTGGGGRVEVKNLNSLDRMRRALKREEERQGALLERGGTVMNETRGYDEKSGTTRVWRSKEDKPDYRFMAEPDLGVLKVDEDHLQRVRDALPPTPRQVRDTLAQAGIEGDAVEVLLHHPDLLDLVYCAIPAVDDPKALSNLVTCDLLGLLRGLNSLETEQLPAPEDLAALVNLRSRGKITSPQRGALLKDLLLFGGPLETHVTRRDYGVPLSPSDLNGAVQSVLDSFPEEVRRWRDGQSGIVNFLTGKVLSALSGRGDPGVIQRELSRRFEEET